MDIARMGIMNDINELGVVVGGDMWGGESPITAYDRQSYIYW